MRSIPVTDETSIALAQAYDGIADFLLLDSHRAGDNQIGALGITHDWSVSARIVSAVSMPVILAGGLGPGNVAEAIRAVGPAGVEFENENRYSRQPCQGSGSRPPLPSGGEAGGCGPIALIGASR